MEILIHKADGTLGIHDPYLTVGTRIRYYDVTSSQWHYGTITEESLKKRREASTTGGDKAVWALWDATTSVPPGVAWMPRGRLEIVDG